MREGSPLRRQVARRFGRAASWRCRSKAGLLGVLAIGPVLVACPMDREEVLEKKSCDSEGRCALGYRCRDDMCVPDDREGKRAHPRELAPDAGADAEAPQEERE